MNTAYLALLAILAVACLRRMMIGAARRSRLEALKQRALTIEAGGTLPTCRD